MVNFRESEIHVRIILEQKPHAKKFAACFKELSCYVRSWEKGQLCECFICICFWWFNTVQGQLRCLGSWHIKSPFAPFLLVVFWLFIFIWSYFCWVLGHDLLACLHMTITNILHDIISTYLMLLICCLVDSDDVPSQQTGFNFSAVSLSVWCQVLFF